MMKKTALAALFCLFLAAPALAQQGVTLSSSDEDFLSEMPLGDFPGASDVDKDGDGIADNVADKINTSNGIGTSEEAPKKTVKYVYKPGSDTYLRRSIQDPRIEDGYVQGLMQQRGPR